MKKVLTLLAALSLTGCGESEEEKAAKALVEEQERQAAINRMIPPNPCTIGTQTPTKELALNDVYEIRSEPNGERIKNEKTSEIMHKTHYHRIDTSTTVKQICADGDWTMVQITSPDWLSHVKGWAPNSVFRNIERSGDGTRVYVESDVYWDEHSNPYRKQIVAKVNELSREDRCKEIDPQTVALSPTRGSKAKPVFFVTCGSGVKAFNVWFNVN